MHFLIKTDTEKQMAVSNVFKFFTEVLSEVIKAR